METPAHRKYLMLGAQSKGRLAGSRSAAAPVRTQIETELAQGGEVILDFVGIEVTQAFVDELLAPPILRHGPHVLQRIVFKNCSEDARAVIEFVAADRCDQFAKGQAR